MTHYGDFRTGPPRWRAVVVDDDDRSRATLGTATLTTDPRAASGRAH